jgi:NhaP-type Na+/H+ or K+/H+ antiporter
VPHHELVQLAGIFVVGIAAQWLAWRFRVPSILLLLAMGALAGPVLGRLDPDHLFGDLLPAIVSLSVAVILYEGGLTLRYRELQKLRIGGVFLRLATIGVLLAWVLGAFALRYCFEFRWPVAILLGAIYVVTGPTVVSPMLRHLRLHGRVGALLKWEGIVVDPVGAVLAVLVYTFIQAGIKEDALSASLWALLKTIVAGLLLGSAAAGVLIVMLWKYWIPDTLHNPVSLMFMFTAFVLANMVQDEAGLLAVTVMGLVLANQRLVSIRHVIEFKETLALLLLSFLFIVLAANLQRSDLATLGWRSVAFLALMMFLVRPVSVFVSTIGSSLSWSERLFIACMAPRGIVAASVASVFATDLVALGYPRAVEMVPITFLLVFITVLVYGISARPLAIRLGLIRLNPQGVLFVGAHAWARTLANALKSEGIDVAMIDTDWANVCLARMSGIPCQYGSALAESTHEQVEFAGLGRLVAVTANDEVNALACLRYHEDFGRNEVYQLPLPQEKLGLHETIPLDQRGRLLFGKDCTFAVLGEWAGNPPTARRTPITETFSYNSYCEHYGGTAIPLFIVRANGTLQVCTVDNYPEPRPGDKVISFAQPRNGEQPAEHGKNRVVQPPA